MESHDDDHHGIPSSLVDEDALLEGRASSGVDLSEVHIDLDLSSYIFML